jgi:uncharacterized protein (DUF302 family)
VDQLPILAHTPYTLTRALPGVPFGEAVARTRSALAGQGFGVLTEIDVKSTMKAKLGKELRDYTILGACNPALAFAALQAEPGVGLLRPCNIVVSADDNGGSVVGAVDPVALFSVVQRPDVAGLAEEVRQRLAKVLDGI